MNPILKWSRVVGRSQYANGEVNVISRFARVWFTASRWRISYRAGRVDGLPRRVVEIGPLMVVWGKDHHWQEAE